MILQLTCCLGPFAGTQYPFLPYASWGRVRGERKILEASDRLRGKPKSERLQHCNLVPGGKLPSLKTRVGSQSRSAKGMAVCRPSTSSFGASGQRKAPARVRSFQMLQWTCNEKAEDSEDPKVMMKRAKDVQNLKLEARGGLQQGQRLPSGEQTQREKPPPWRPGWTASLFPWSHNAASLSSCYGFLLPQRNKERMGECGPLRLSIYTQRECVHLGKSTFETGRNHLE